MRIAQVPPLYEAVPPRLYGGTERIISYITEELVARGHDVTLFGTGEAETRAELVVVRDKALRLDPAPLTSPIAAHLAMLDEVRRRADRFDVIHFHLSHFQQFPMFEGIAERTVTTPHGRLDYVDLPKFTYERAFVIHQFEVLRVPTTVDKLWGGPEPDGIRVLSDAELATIWCAVWGCELGEGDVAKTPAQILHEARREILKARQHHGEFRTTREKRAAVANSDSGVLPYPPYGE